MFTLLTQPAQKILFKNSINANYYTFERQMLELMKFNYINVYGGDMSGQKRATQTIILKYT